MRRGMIPMRLIPRAALLLATPALAQTAPTPPDAAAGTPSADEAQDAQGAAGAERGATAADDLLTKYKGEWLFPILVDYPEEKFGGFLAQTDYRDPVIASAA